MLRAFKCHVFKHVGQTAQPGDIPVRTGVHMRENRRDGCIVALQEGESVVQTLDVNLLFQGGRIVGPERRLLAYLNSPAMRPIG